MNNTPTRFTGKEPDDAIELENVESVREKIYRRVVGLDEERLDGFSQVRYLYSDGELEGGEKRRATDPIWSLEVYNLDRSVVSKNEPVLYYLSKGAPKRDFVKEELQIVFESELPPDSILK